MTTPRIGLLLSPDDFNELATDLIRRTNDAITTVCERAVTERRGLNVAEVVELVEAGLPDTYPVPSAISRPEAIRHLTVELMNQRLGRDTEEEEL